MKRLLFLAVLSTFVVGCGPSASGQSTVDSDERKARIVANLRYAFPQVREHTVVVDALFSSGFGGLDRGTFTINGQQTQAFFVSSDDKQFYLVAAEPIDVSRTAEELAVLDAQAAAQALSEAKVRSVELATAISDMPVRGRADAPVTIIEFSDFQCPYCSRAYETVEQVLAKYPDDVRLVYAHFPLPNHPWAKPAAIAATCAARHDDSAFWALHDGYFKNQSSIDAANVLLRSRSYLADKDIDLAAWETCASDKGSAAYQEAAAAVDRSIALGSRYGVSGTPGFFVNGQFLNGAQPMEAFDAAIGQAMIEGR